MFANALIANAPQSYEKYVRIYTLQTVSCEITEKLIHLCHDKGKKQRSLHYPFGNSARNAVFVLRSYDGVVNLAGMVLSIHLATATSNTTTRFSRWGGALWQFDVAFIVHVLVDYLIDVGESKGTL